MDGSTKRPNLWLRAAARGFDSEPRNPCAIVTAAFAKRNRLDSTLIAVALAKLGVCRPSAMCIAFTDGVDAEIRVRGHV